MQCGIYQIRNIVNGKIYVGSSKNMPQRWKKHRSKLKHRKHPSKHLQNAWDKYGACSFVFEVLEECDLSLLIVKEQYYLDTLNPCDREVGYNTFKHAGAHCDTMNNRPDQEPIRDRIAIGVKRWWSNLTDDAKTAFGKTLSESQKGRKFSDTHKLNKSNAQRGSKNPIARSVRVGEQTFGTITEAANECGIKYTTLVYRINSPSYPEYSFA